MRKLLLMAFILALTFSSISCESNAEEVMPAPTTSSSAPAGTAVTISDEDIEWLSIAIVSEAGSVYDGGQWVRCTDEERAAVGWTIINRLKAGTYGDSIQDIVTAPAQYAYNQEPNAKIIELAEKLLQGQVEDTTSGATHFFSPISMPKEGDSTAGFDTGGGLNDVAGIDKKAYFPSWIKTMNYAGDLKNVRPAYFMFYRGTRTTQQADVPTLIPPQEKNKEMGQSPDTPIPLGTPFSASGTWGGMELMVLKAEFRSSVVPNPPTHSLMVTVKISILGESGQTTNIFNSDFGVFGSKGEGYGGGGLAGSYLAGVELTRTLSFRVPTDDSNFVLLWTHGRRFFALE